MSVIKFPEEFRSANNVPVERATITRDRMEEIVKEVHTSRYGGHAHGVYTGKAIEALKSAQNNVCARRPFGTSADPNSDDYDHDTFMWDFYQAAIDSLTDPSGSNGLVEDLQLQLAALTEDYKDLEAQLLAVGAGGVSKLIGDSE